MIRKEDALNLVQELNDVIDGIEKYHLLDRIADYIMQDNSPIDVLVRRRASEGYYDAEESTDYIWSLAGTYIHGIPETNPHARSFALISGNRAQWKPKLMRIVVGRLESLGYSVALKQVSPNSEYIRISWQVE